MRRSCQHYIVALAVPSVVYSDACVCIQQPVMPVQMKQGGAGGPFWPGVTDSLQLNHSGGRLSAWQDRAERPSHLLRHL